MPFALVTIGLMMIVSGARNTYEQLGAQLVTDFRGFIWWIAAIIAIGALGYVPQFKPFSRALLVLVLIIMVLHNRGFAQNFLGALQKGPTQLAAGPDAAAGVTSGSASTQSISTASTAGTIGNLIKSSFALFGL